MNNNQKKILLAFSTYANKGLMREVFTQLDRKIRIDFAGNESDVLYYLNRNRTRSLPGLIVFDDPPMRPNIGEFVDNFHKDDLYADIPVAMLLPRTDIPTMTRWVRKKQVYLFPRPSLPSECKMYVRQMLEHYQDVMLVKAGVAAIILHRAAAPLPRSCAGATDNVPEPLP